MAEMTTVFFLEKDEEPMAREPMYLRSDESEYSTPHATPDYHHESFHPDSNNQLKASQLKQRSNMDTTTVFYPPTPNTSMIADNEKQQNLTPIIGNNEQHISHILQRENHRIRLCQPLQPVPDTPESPLPADQGQRDLFSPYDFPNSSTSAPYNNLPIISGISGYRDVWSVENQMKRYKKKLS